MKISYMMYDPVPDLDELARRMTFLAGLGYHGVEIVGTQPMGYDVAALADIARFCRLPVVSMLSGWSYPNEGLCLSSPDPEVRDRAVGRLHDYLGRVATLNALLVVGLMQGLRSDEPDEAKAGDRIAVGLSRVAQRAEQLGVSVVIEPVNHLQVGFHHTADAASALAARVGSPALGYMLDTIHMNIEERSMFDTIRRHGPRIRHFHLCETNGGPFGSGALDFPRVLAALDEACYAGVVSVKVYRHETWEESARSSAEFLKRLGVDLGGRGGAHA